MILLKLFWEFFKTGLFAVGGGMATLPFLSDMSDKFGWFTQAQLIDMIAVSESTPGPIGVNMATYIGFETAGVLGCVIATLGLITPSVIVILIIAQFLKAFGDNRYVNAAFYGLRPASTGLIASAGVGVLSVVFLNTDLFTQTGNIRDLFQIGGIVLAALIFVLTNYVKPTKKLHPIAFIAFAAIVGIVFKL